MRNKNILISFVVVIAFFVFLFYSPLEGWLACETGWKICPPPPAPDGAGYSSRGEPKCVKIAGQNIKVEVSLTPEARARGLSGRENLPAREGMLFVFDRPGRYNFWMRDMKFPIDIIWFTPSEGGAGDELKVVYIKNSARPESYPEAYSPNAEAQYVLEVASGFSEKNNLQAGDRVKFVHK